MLIPSAWAAFSRLPSHSSRAISTASFCRSGLPPLAALLAMYVGFHALGVAGMVLTPLALMLAKALHDAGLLHLWQD